MSLCPANRCSICHRARDAHYFVACGREDCPERPRVPALPAPSAPLGPDPAASPHRIYAVDTASGIGMTVGELRKRIEGLPDDTPVLYQRVQDVCFLDYNWKSVRLKWEVYPYHAGHEPLADDMRVFEKDGQKFIREYDDFVHAFSAYTTQDDAGRTVLCIHAHY